MPLKTLRTNLSLVTKSCINCDPRLSTYLHVGGTSDLCNTHGDLLTSLIYSGYTPPTCKESHSLDKPYIHIIICTY